MIGNPTELSGATKPTSIEVDGYDKEISAHRFAEIPSNMQQLVDYDIRTDFNPVYIGYAAPGLSEDSSGWLIYNYTYDVNNRFISRKVCTNDSWTNRATATYQ